MKSIGILKPQINIKMNANPPLRDAFSAIFLWSTQAVCMSYGTIKTDFSAILFPAFLVSSLFFLFFKLYHGNKIRRDVIPSLQKKNRHIILGSFFIFGSQFFFYFGIQIGPKVETNLTFYIWPLIFILISLLLFSDKFSNRLKRENLVNRIGKILGDRSLILKTESMRFDRLKTTKIIAGFTGVGLVLSSGELTSINLTDWKGPLYGLIAGLIWVFFSVYLKLLDKISCIALFIAGSTLLSGILWGIRGFPEITPTTTLIALYLGIFPMGFAMLFWERAMKNNHTQEIGLLSFLAPLLSTLLLYLFKIDNINQWIVLGGTLIVLANIPFRDIRDRLSTFLNFPSINVSIDSTSRLEYKDIFKNIVLLLTSDIEYKQIVNLSLVFLIIFVALLLLI